MKVFESISTWQQHRAMIKDKTIGFVPTMGNLHQGHLALYQQSIDDNQLTVASIFINPTQFNNQNDFNNYPKTLEQDLKRLEQLGVDYCLLPSEQEIYPDQYAYRLSENKLSQMMEGVHRPGHFDGMLTIVLKLLNLVQATNAYFGEKDYQQFALVKKMAQALFLKTAIIPYPTVRDSYGLALSSRNNRLSASQLQKARLFAKIFHQSHSIDETKAELIKEKIKIDYVEEFEGRRYAAVFINDIRLIDNFRER